MEKIIKYIKGIKAVVWGILICLAVLIAGISVLLNGAASWVLDTWGLLSVDEIIFHLKVPLDGTSADVIQGFLIQCAAPTILFVLFVAAVCIAVRHSKRAQRILLVVLGTLSVFLCTFAFSYVWKELKLGSYVREQKEISMFVDKNYRDPRETAITFPEQKRNIIYIYLESMENTYMNRAEGGAYSDNYIPELTELARNNIQFSNGENMGGAYTTVGSTWTMGGMFAQTAGLPLKLEIDGNAMDTQDVFMPDIYTLGDILEEQDYRQVLMLGSDASFGGRQSYFEQHGNYEMWDYATAVSLSKFPGDYRVWWGYEDEKLFSYAAEKLTELGNGGEPFNFTMLTADSHFEDGYVCPLCQDQFPGDQYANVLACSSRQVANFIAWIQQQPFYANTTIVLSGDHLTMDANFCEDIDKDYERTVFNTFINSAAGTENTKNRQFTTMDMLPTTLASMGVTMEGDRLALGTNLFSATQTLTEEVGIKKQNKELSKKSLFYNYLTKDVDKDKAEAAAE